VVRAAEATSPPGVLRLLVIFHESEALGAGTSVLRALDGVRSFGWSPSAWFPGDGQLVDEAAGATEQRLSQWKPLAYSTRGWRAAPGLGSRVRATPGYLRAVRAALLRLRPHVVHVNTLRALPEARIARSLGVPVVLQVHELPAPGAKRTLTLKWAAHVADVLVGVSEPVTELLREHAGSKPVLTIHNGVPPDVVSGRAPEPGLVGTIGTVCRTKGTDIFLEAAALALERCPELRFEHIGQAGLDDDTEFERRVSLLAESPGLTERVEMLGRRPAADGLRRWEMFVLASRQDAFPLATLEAMAAGVPVIATEVGGLPEQIVHLESGILVAPDDPEAVAEWIVRLHHDAVLRERLGAAAAERVRTTFGLARQAEGLHKAYLAALNLRHAPPPVRRATLEAL
jgi:glycosyltransferase involved in cell wall biosynthesis